MRVFCDTSVLVAACVTRHPHFSRARPVLESVALGRDEGSVSCHSLAEVYSALTLLPLSPRILPGEAERIIDASIRRRFRLIAVSAAMYEAAVATCVRMGLAGGKVYDALLLECARKAKLQRIYTFNTSDFLRLAPDLGSIITAP